jgi:hypothetical protein
MSAEADALTKENYLHPHLLICMYRGTGSVFRKVTGFFHRYIDYLAAVKGKTESSTGPKNCSRNCSPGNLRYKHGLDP